jgi:hypothetical protein
VWVVENGLFNSLVATLEMLNEEGSVEEYEVALQVLKLVKALLELWEEAAEPLVGETNILDYLANCIMPNYQVSHKVMEYNKLVSSAALAILLSHSLPAQLSFHRLCGVELLLESIRPYLSRVPPATTRRSAFPTYLIALPSCSTTPVRKWLNPMKSSTQ